MRRYTCLASLSLAFACASCLTATAIEPMPANTATALRSAYLEPPKGRILHLTAGTVGQQERPEVYTAMTGPERAPLGVGLWMSLPGTRGWDRQRSKVIDLLGELAASHRIASLSVRFDDGQRTANGASDTDVALGKHDELIDDLARIIKDSRVPVLLRIGNETNGPWEQHHPHDLPKAFRRIVERFRKLGVRNVAFVWCVSPGGDAELFAKDDQGQPRWFPGDDVIDWYGIDVFDPIHFSHNGGSAPAATSDAYIPYLLLDAARRHDKPVLVAECTPLRMNIQPLTGEPASADAKRIWRAWFEPLLAWLTAHPQIKGVTMISVDWTRTRNWPDWGDARIENNQPLVELWNKELGTKRWLHQAQLATAFSDGRWQVAK